MSELFKKDTVIRVDECLKKFKSDLKIIAVDVVSGKVIWEIQSIDAPARRGMVLSKENNNKYLFINIKNNLYKINIDNGELEK